MRLITLLAALPLLVAAQDQHPLMASASSLWDMAKSYIPTQVPEPIAHPIDTAAAGFADKRVHKITHTNYESKLTPTLTDPSDGPEEWMILISGGNKSCYGRCGEVEKAWNAAIPMISILTKAPKFGYVDCDRQALLCTTWAAGVPSIYFFQLPIVAPGQSPPRTPLYIIPVNTTSITTTEIVNIVSKRSYTPEQQYDGLYHPINGQLQVFGLLKPLGYVMWAFSQVPSFVFMILISFVSRNIMGRRASARAGAPGAPGQPAPAAGAQ